jgi:thiol-disulfide isomerase/thioredoxin
MTRTAFLCLLAALVVGGCAGAGVVTSGPGENSLPVEEETASIALDALYLEDMSGQRIPLDEWLGRDVIVVSFWATFCKPCKAEMPFLDKLHRDHEGKGLKVLAISLDTPETESGVRPLIQRNRYAFAVAVDRQSDATRLLNAKSILPHLVIIDRRGRVVLRKDGFTVGDQAPLTAVILRLLGR